MVYAREFAELPYCRGILRGVHARERRGGGGGERERNVQSGALIGKKEEALSWRGRVVERGWKGERGNSLDGGLLEATMEPVPRFFSKRPGLRSTHFS